MAINHELSRPTMFFSADRDEQGPKIVKNFPALFNSAIYRQYDVYNNALKAEE